MAMSWEEIAGERMREINRLRAVVRGCNNTIDRKNDMLFQVIQYAREQAGAQFSDWKDADDWLFSNFDITKEELEEIYDGKGVTVYGASCVGGRDPVDGQNGGNNDEPLNLQSM